MHNLSRVRYILVILAAISGIFMISLVQAYPARSQSQSIEAPSLQQRSTDLLSISSVFTPTNFIYLPIVSRNYPEYTVCASASTAVVLLLNPKLVDSIRANLNQFEVDLCNEGYTVIERVSNFATPPQARNYLAELYTRTGKKLEGAIIVGDFPRAYQWVNLVYSNPTIPPLEEEVISFQYYSDLDGVFSTSPNYVSPGNHTYSYDVHSGNVNWEIWTGILPYYKGSITETASALNRYFVKNHSYRTGGYNIPRAYLEINELISASTQAEQDQELSYMRNGIYAWTPFSNAPNARLYMDGPTLSVAQGYADLQSAVADFTVTGVHGNPYVSGQINIPWVESNSVRTVFFYSSGCSIGNLDYADNFLASIVYSPTSLVLVSQGSTNESGGMGNNQNGFYGHNIATALTQGKNYGQALLSHINIPLVYPWSDAREFHFGVIVAVGDLTLKLRP